MQLSDITQAQSLVGLFLARADALGDQPFLSAKMDGEWCATTWREAARQVCALAAALREMGLVDGDRVMIVSENRPEWCIADLAIMAAGLVTVPAYITNTEGDHRHVLDDSGARAVIVSNGRLLGPLRAAMSRAGRPEHLIAIEPVVAAQSGSFAYHRWQDLVANSDAAAARREIDARLATASRDDLACIIYTSGTSGSPRGVMLPHGALLANVASAGTAIVGDFGWGEERFLSILPLSHAFEHTAGFLLPIGLGAEIWFAEGLDKLSTNLSEARPTIMVVVPRLFEVLRTRIMRAIEKEGWLANTLFQRAMRIGQARLDRDARWHDAPVDALLDRTIRPKIAARFGGRVKALISGGAPLNPEIGAFFQGLGLTLLQGYGQTEAAPIVSCNIPSRGLRLRTVGPALSGTEVRIADDGEILVRGELVMQGYWNNPAETARTIRDGWLHTGDIGHLDEDGRIVITDRKKDLIVNDKGDNIAPQKLEGMLTLQPEIAQAMVSGDKRPYVVALIAPDAEWTGEWARSNGAGEAEPAALAANSAFRSAIKAAIERTNAELPVTEKVRKFVLADEPFTVENNEMTPTLKIRRHQLRERYGARLEQLY